MAALATDNEWSMADWVRDRLPNPAIRKDGNWLVFSRDRWVQCTELDMVRAVAQTIEVEIDRLTQQFRELEPEERKGMASVIKSYRAYLNAQQLKHIVYLVGCLVESTEAWDSRVDDFPAANGLIHLPSGRITANNPRFLISRYSNIEHNPDAKCPRWDAFMREIMLNDEGMVKFLQRAAGYTLTARLDEQVLFILYGSGANGKNVFLEVMYDIWGELAHQTSFKLLERSHGGSDNPAAASPHLTALHGKRFVMASESNEGSFFNDGLVKSLTGDGQIVARGLYRDEGVFTNTAKFWLACNNMPQVRDVTPGFWRRLIIIPFKAQFLDARRDLGLKDQLRSELPGILNWCLDGAREWYAGKLQVPESVYETVGSYRENENPLGQFFEDACLIHKDVYVTKMSLYKAYSEYVKAELGTRPLRRERFYAIIGTNGFNEAKRGRNKVFEGLCLKNQAINFPLTMEDVAGEGEQARVYTGHA